MYSDLINDYYFKFAFKFQFAYDQLNNFEN